VALDDEAAQRATRLLLNLRKRGGWREFKTAISAAIADVERMKGKPASATVSVIRAPRGEGRQKINLSDRCFIAAKLQGCLFRCKAVSSAVRASTRSSFEAFGIGGQLETKKCDG